MPDTRTPAERIAALQRHGTPISDETRAQATALLEDLLAAAERHQVALADFDWVADLPGACLDVMTSRGRE